MFWAIGVSEEEGKYLDYSLLIAGSSGKIEFTLDLRNGLEMEIKLN